MVESEERKTDISLMEGVKVVLVVDPFDTEVADLYLPESLWDRLIKRLRGNKLKVALRGDFEIPDDVLIHIREDKDHWEEQK